MTSEIFPEQAAAQLPSSNNIARRSVSIFSRKGTDSPVPTIQALALTSTNMGLGTPSFASGTSSVGKMKSKRWTMMGRVETKTSGGTILRAVPKEAPTPSMTPLEREMATSPNEEILKAIGLTLESAPTSPVDAPSSPLSDVTNTPRRYYSKRGKTGQSDYLGVWQNGQVSWGQENGKTPDPSVTRPKTSDGNRPSSDRQREKAKLVKPRIQVIIPEDHSARRPFSFMPFFQPTSNNKNTTTNELVSPPSVTSGDTMGSAQISAISPPTVTKPKMHRPFQRITTAIDESLTFDGGLLVGRPAHSRSTSMNSSNSDSEGDDASFAQSSRSSMTSIGVHNDEQRSRKGEPLSRSGSSSSEASYKANDDASGITAAIDETPSQKAPMQGPRMNDMISMVRNPSTASRTSSGRKKRLSSSRGQMLLAKINSREELRLHDGDTPTLDEAVENLENSLSSFMYDNDGADAPEVVDVPPVQTAMSPIPEIVFSPVEAPPALPRKSSKRSRLSFPPQDAIVEAPTSPPTPKAPAPNPDRVAAVPSSETFTTAMAAVRLEQRRQEMHALRRERRESFGRIKRMSSVRSVLSLVREEDEFPSVETNTAETVVYHILSNLESMDDLFNAALITKGFHHVFKEHELELMQIVLQKQCPPAWEYRESCLDGEEYEDDSAAPLPEHTPSTYFQGYKADMITVTSLKHMIEQQCSTLLTADTLTALRQGEALRVDAALYRIWTFCRVFGYGKGREDDIVAQMDWLRGGLLAHQDACTSTISNHDSFYMSNVLLNAPEHFAQGNAGGLSAEELYDMLEMWNCLTKLTSGITGKTEQARQFGIFDETDIAGGDVDGEEAMLEEWQAYILTLGLAPVLGIVSALATGGSHNAFATAQYNGLSHWNAPLLGSSRTTFLHEAVSRLYEERICEAFSPEQVQMKEMRSIRRNRDSEFRQRRLSTRSMQYPERSTRLSREWGSFRSAEAPSTASSQMFTADPGLARSSSQRARRAPPPLQITNSHLSSSIRRSYYPISESIAEEHFPPAYDPAVEAERERAQMHPLQRALIADNDPSTNSADKAVFRIVEMGFTAEEAKGALKITDMGDGLRVDRAVEYLMRSKGFA